MFLKCHLYLGLGNSTAKEIRWWHNSSVLNSEDLGARDIQVEDKIVLDVIKESTLKISKSSFSDAGDYKCSTSENKRVVKSLEVDVEVLIRKYSNI